MGLVLEAPPPQRAEEDPGWMNGHDHGWPGMPGRETCAQGEGEASGSEGLHGEMLCKPQGTGERCFISIIV